MPAMADNTMASASAAIEPMSSKRMRPSGSTAIAVNLFVRAAVDALSHIACQPPEGPWDWDARQYPIEKGIDAPNLAALNNHSQVLLELIRIVPNARPIHDRLRNVFVTLHKSFKIFSMQVPCKSAGMGPSVRAWKAATRWCVMCRHCLFLVTNKEEIPDRFEGLKEVLAAIQLPESKPMAATVSEIDSLVCDFEVNILQCMDF